MREKKTESPALHLIRHVAQHEGHQRGRSWDKTNHARAAAMDLAVLYGLEFHEDDGADIADVCSRLSRWERWYAVACGAERGSENRSAQKMIEKYLGRTPFLVRHSPGDKIGDRTPARVYVGLEFQWYGERVTVTSFQDAAKTFTACTYKPQESQTDAPAKIAKRYAITHDAIRDYHAAIKAWGQLMDEVGALPHLTMAQLQLWAQTEFPEPRYRNRGGLTLKEIERVRAKMAELVAAQAETAAAS